MDRYANLFAVTDVDCDLCARVLRLTLVDDNPREGEVTVKSKTVVCPHCWEEVPIRFYLGPSTGRPKRPS